MNELSISAQANRQEVTLSYILFAARTLVFDTFTNPELIPQWWGPEQYKTKIDKYELRPGGIWRFIQFDNDGNEFAFHGVYHEVNRPENLVYTFEFEGMPGHVLLETVLFKEQNDKTLITDQSVFQSVEDRDGMLNTGMVEGSKQTIQRLSKLLQKLTA